MIPTDVTKFPSLWMPQAYKIKLAAVWQKHFLALPLPLPLLPKSLRLKELRAPSYSKVIEILRRKQLVGTMASWWELHRNKVLILSLIVGISVGMLFLGHSILSSFEHMREWFLARQPWSIVLFMATFILSISIFLPFSAFCLGCGYIWGVGKGFAIMYPTLIVMSASLYALSRKLGGGALIQKLLERDAEVLRVSQQLLTTSTRDAAILNALLCFVPMSMGMHVYVFCFSDLSVSLFVLTFCVGMLPNTLVYLFLGNSAYESSVNLHDAHQHNLSIFMLCVSVFFLLFLAFFVSNKVKSIIGRGARNSDDAEAGVQGDETTSLLQ